MNCPKCNKETEHSHKHRTAHGIEGTHIVGSEHYRCEECGHIMFRKEAEAQGLRFFLDTKPTGTDEHPGYRKRVIDHFRNGHATDEDWALMSQILFEVSILGSPSGEDDGHLSDLNRRIRWPLEVPSMVCLVDCVLL